MGTTTRKGNLQRPVSGRPEEESMIRMKLLTWNNTNSAERLYLSSGRRIVD